ncbi:aminotransferase class V-fold PLP-dependent enzyme [Frigidibacter sp. SD6-1]|uniref:aminotransferase class V-fold PLP-dependent enzyme n=1 Tax=Frigidibacter sp. SD6-1 TaxID=3032581 RepID=UPI0024DF9AB1|nr:aminotransferase class V-fold PLP-dependent enzyme [Frigidibacter sp. SD6-1]
MTDQSDGSRYFLYHSIGQYPGKAADLARSMAEFAGVWGRPDDGQWPAVLGIRQRFIDRWRGILKAPEGSVTTAESVTAAVSSLITALPPDRLRGKRLLIAADCFPSVHFLLQGLAGPMGFTLDTVPLRQGAHWVEDEDFLASWDEGVGLALLTWISSTSSHRIALEPLVAHGRRMGSLIGVDITQGAGLLPFDVSAPEVDFAVSTSLKWMCGTPGAGALYVASALLPDCEPLLRGWFSQDDPFRWDLDRFAFAPDARRFDHGTPGVMAAAASLPALDWHAAQDAPALLAHNRSLSARILDGLDDLGLTLASPRAEDQRGGSLMVRLPDGRPAPALVDALRAQGIHCDARGQTLRLSPGVMTTADGVAALIAALTAALR